MPLDPSHIGRTYPPTPPYEVGREKIREFADAIGDPHPAYRDTEAAKELGHPDVIAPPTFVGTLTLQAMERVARDPELGLGFSHVVHGDQRFEYARPVRAGDRLAIVVSIDNIRAMAGSDIITARGVVDTVEGEHVVTVLTTLLFRAPE